MFKQSPSRNQRSKGFKVKHALQIGLLLAVCIWLLYQVKHSHDKKKAFNESNVKISERLQSGHEILKLGRKDLDPRVGKTANENEKHSSEEETEEDEEESNNEDEENKPEESEDEGRGGGDDEIDEQDQEEAEREEDFIDEEERHKEDENEAEESGEKEGQVNGVGLSEDQDHDARDRNTQEAREEHYRRDDASSAVVRDTQMISTETESGNSHEEERLRDAENNELEHENRTNTTVEADIIQNNSGKNEGDTTVSEEKGNQNTLSESEASSNSTVMTESKLLTTNAETPVSSMQNGSEIASDLTQVLNVTTEARTHNENATILQTVVPEQTGNSNIITGGGQSDFNVTLSTVTEDAGSKNEFSDSSGNSESVLQEQIIKDANAGSEERSETSVMNENADAAQTQSGEHETSRETKETDESSASSRTEEKVDAFKGEKSNTDAEMKQAGESKESSTTDENTDAVVQSEIVDSSVTQQENVARTDLETLPDTKTVGNNSEEVTAE